MLFLFPTDPVIKKISETRSHISTTPQSKFKKLFGSCKKYWRFWNQTLKNNIIFQTLDYPFNKIKICETLLHIYKTPQNIL